MFVGKKRVESLRKIIRLHVYLAGQSGFTSFGVQNWPNCGQSKTRFFCIDRNHSLVMAKLQLLWVCGKPLFCDVISYNGQFVYTCTNF